MMRSAFVGVVWSVVRTLASRGMNTVVFIVLARMLDPAAFGLVALASVFVALMQVFVDQGFSQSLIQRPELDGAHLDSAFWASLAIGAALTGVGIATAGVVSDALGQPDLAPVLRVLSFGLLISALSSTPEAVLTRELAFGRLALRKLVATAAGGIAGVAAAVGGMGVWSLVLQIIVQGAVGAVVLWVATPWRPRLRFSRRHFRELFGFGSNVVLVTLLNFLNRRADDLLIGAVLGARALGIYSIAYKLLLLVTDVMTRAIDAVAFPVFSRVQLDPERMKRGYLMATRVSTAVAAPVFLAMAALAPEIVPLAFGDKWHAAVPVMQVLSFIGVLHASLFFNSTVLLAAGQARRVVVLTAVNAVSNVVAFAAAVHWGIVAVAAAYVIRGYLLSPLPIMMVRRVVAIRWSVLLWQVAPPFVCAVLMGAIQVMVRMALGSNVPDAATLAILVIVGATAYPVAMALLAPRFAVEIWASMEGAVPGLRRLRPQGGWRRRWRARNAES